MRLAIAATILALIITAPAEELIRAKAKIEEIAKSPATWENKTLPIGGNATGVRQVGASYIGTCGTLTVVFTAEAWTYLSRCKKAGIVPVYEGEVQRDPTDGTLKLFLKRGLNTAR